MEINILKSPNNLNFFKKDYSEKIINKKPLKNIPNNALSTMEIPIESLKAFKLNSLKKHNPIDKIRNHFELVYEQISKKLDFEPVRKFKSDYYFKAVNNFLRKDVVDSRIGTKSELEEIVNGVDKVFENSIMPKNITVYRGINSRTKDRILSSNGIFEDKGFMSTSYLKESAKLFGGSHIVEIEVPKGSKAIDMKTALPQARWEDWEEELLLPRNSRFEIKSIDEENSIIKLRLLNK